LQVQHGHLLRGTEAPGREKNFIDCTGVEDALDVTMAQRSELDYLIYNDPLGYADLILDSGLEGYIASII